MKPSYVVSLSGGKDSTALLLMMLERGESVADIVFFDGGWEFPQMHDHLAQLEGYTGLKITRLKPRSPFDLDFAKRDVFSKQTGEFRRSGRGWPSPLRRWCTREKINAIWAWCTGLTYKVEHLPVVQCIGYALDEPERAEKHAAKKAKVHQAFRYPLIEWGITEDDALTYCKERGFTWGGLYEHFHRVSCFCCPLSSLDNLRKLRRHYPDLWARMLEMESWLPDGDIGRQFKEKTTVSDLDARFAAEDVHESRILSLLEMPGVRTHKNISEKCPNAVNSDGQGVNK